MWTRKEVKAGARAALSRNYWKCVLLAIVLAIVLGSSAGSSVGPGGLSLVLRLRNHRPDASLSIPGDSSIPLPDFLEGIEGLPEGMTDWLEDLDGIAGRVGPKGLNYDLDSLFGFIRPVFAVIAGILLIVGLVAGVIGILIRVFLLNPLEVGGRRFFAVNDKEPARVGELGFAFDSRYMNIVKTMFFRDLFLFLWSLLFIIPGIIKSYSYMLVPYILGDHPDMDAQDAITLSRSMMRGNKWRAFVLQLSFLGWWILSLFTLGLLGVFYVRPYENAAEAAMYQAIKAQTLQEF